MPYEIGNSGNHNTGGFNSGNYNTGNHNTGNHHSSDYNSGFFNTKTNKKIDVFNVSTDKEEWHNCQKPSFIYFDLNGMCYKDAFQESYNKATKEDQKKIFNIPNFDADIFFEISGIDVRLDREREIKKQALIAKANELLEQAKNM